MAAGLLPSPEAPLFNQRHSSRTHFRSTHSGTADLLNSTAPARVVPEKWNSKPSALAWWAPPPPTPDLSRSAVQDFLLRLAQAPSRLLEHLQLSHRLLLRRKEAWGKAKWTPMCRTRRRLLIPQSPVSISPDQTRVIALW